MAVEKNVPRLERNWQWLGYAAYGRVGEAVAGIALIGELWFVLISYIVIAATNLNILFPSLSVKSGIFLSGACGNHRVRVERVSAALQDHLDRDCLVPAVGDL